MNGKRQSASLNKDALWPTHQPVTADDVAMNAAEIDDIDKVKRMNFRLREIIAEHINTHDKTRQALRDAGALNDSTGNNVILAIAHMAARIKALEAATPGANAVANSAGACASPGREATES